MHSVDKAISVVLQRRYTGTNKHSLSATYPHINRKVGRKGFPTAVIALSLENVIDFRNIKKII